MPETNGIKLDQEKTAQFTKDTFEVNDQAVQSVRQEIPIGVGGTPIERIPFNQQLSNLVQSGTYIKRIASGERCIRLVDIPLKSGKIGKFHCSKMAVQVGGSSYCPDHDKEMFKSDQTHYPRNQRVFNSASISLTDAEKTITYEKDGKKYTVSLEDGKDLAQAYREEAEEHVDSKPSTIKRSKTKISRPTIRKTNPDMVIVRLSLGELEGDYAEAAIRTSIITALDQLPASTVADMKRIVAIQEKLGGGK